MSGVKDIAERLRDYYSGEGRGWPVMADAAARIETLEKALTLITEMDGDQPARSDWDMVRIARAAIAKATGAA